MSTDDSLIASAKAPQKPARLSVRFERIGDRITLVNTQRQWAPAAFLLVWLSGWTVGCVVLVGVVFVQQNIAMLLFAVPFWAAWFFVFAMVGGMIASREELRLDEAGIDYRRRIWGYTISKRQVPLQETTRFVRSKNKGQRQNQSSPGIELRTVHQPLALAASLAADERKWILAELNDALASLKRYSGPIDRKAEAAPPLDPEKLPDVLELRPPSLVNVSRPNESAMHLTSDLDSVTFTTRGGLTLSALGGVLFINLFWNGIVGVFVLALLGFSPDGNKQAIANGWDWWVMFFFLIPFEIIGLIMFIVLVLTLLEPVRRSYWILHRNAIVQRTAWLGLGYSWRYEVMDLDHLELRKQKANDDQEDEDGDEEDGFEQDDDDSPSESGSERGQSVKDRFEAMRRETAKATDEAKKNSQLYSLVPIDRHGKEVCKITDLSLAEACWMADVILRERTAWFPRSR